MNPAWHGRVVLHPWTPQAIGGGGVGVGSGVGVGVGSGVETGGGATGGGATGVGAGVGEKKPSASQSRVSSLVPPVVPQLLIAETSHL